MVHLRLNSQAESCPSPLADSCVNGGSLLWCLGHPSPQSPALGTHRLHDPGDSWVFAKLLHKQMVLAGHLKGFGEEVALGCLQLSRLALQLFPEALQVLHHVVLAGQLSSTMDRQAIGAHAHCPAPTIPPTALLQPPHQLPPTAPILCTVKVTIRGTPLVVQWVGLCTPNAGCLGSVPGQGTRCCMPQLRSPHAATKRSHMPQRRSHVPQLRPGPAKINK